MDRFPLIVIYALLVTNCHHHYIHCTQAIASNELPKLNEVVPRRNQLEGSKLNIFCAPQQGSKPFRFEWFKNGQPLHHSRPSSSRLVRHRIDTSEDQSLLTIAKLVANDSGNYSCTVANQYGHDTLATSVLVKGWSWCDASSHGFELEFAFCLNMWRFSDARSNYNCIHSLGIL